MSKKKMKEALEICFLASTRRRSEALKVTIATEDGVRNGIHFLAKVSPR